MAPRKREREEDEVDLAVQELESVVSRDPEIKLKALDSLRKLFDPLDEGYTAQKKAASLGVLNVLMQLLEDDSEAVAAEAALTLAALTSHIAAVMHRLEDGQAVGYSETPEKVQDTFNA
eukprot:jgi/Chrzof1/9447/Cz04g03130.t1